MSSSSSPTILNLPLHFDFTADPRGYDWQVAIVNEGDLSSAMCQVSVNYIHGDFEYNLKREIQDKMVESMFEWWEVENTEKERPYYEEEFDFGEIDDRLEGDTESSLTELIHERLDEYFDNADTFDLSDWVNEKIGESDYYADLNQYEFNDGTLYDWFVEALEHHGDADEIYQHFCDENLDGEIWGACLHEILEWIDKTYKPKTIDELTEKNKTLKEEIETLKEKNKTLTDRLTRSKSGRLLVEEIETLKEKNYTLRRLLEGRNEAIESWKEVEKTLTEEKKEWENTTMNYRRLMDEIDAEVPEEERNDEWIGSGTIQGLLEYIERIRKENAEAKK